MTTTNRVLNTPARGSETGTWDTPLNANFSALDTMLGGVLTTSVSSGAYNLASTAYSYGILRFTGALAGNVTVTLPSKSCFYIVDNQTTGASYYIQFTAGGSEVIAVPQGKATDIFVDGSNNVKFRNMPDPGTYWDYSGGTAPVWIGACTKVPWLVCDGSTFLIATHPHLAAIHGAAFGGDGITTSAVPDLQNRVRVALKASSPRLTSGGSGIDGAARGAAGGSETHQLTVVQMASHYHSGTTGQGGVDHTHTIQGNVISITPGGGNQYYVRSAFPSGSIGSTDGASAYFHTHDFNTTYQGADVAHNNTQPTLVHGLTFVKT